jgi:hypothetical protein
MGISSEFFKNLSHDEAFFKHICPFVNREVTTFHGEMYNMSEWGIMTVFATDRAVDSDWPVRTKDCNEHKYIQALRKHLWEVQKANVSEEAFREAVMLTERGEYKAISSQVVETFGRRESFFICPMDNPEVNHNYEYVIKPLVKQFQFDIQKVDEISHTLEITDVILEAIVRSRFVIADLTDARPNCYYEVGYAHALRKAVIILAKKGTPRHFDISTYKWNYWESYTDLKPVLECELRAVMAYFSQEASEKVLPLHRLG